MLAAIRVDAFPCEDEVGEVVCQAMLGLSDVVNGAIGLAEPECAERQAVRPGSDEGCSSSR